MCLKPQSDALIVDGSSLVYSFHPTEATFESFAKNVFEKKVEGFSITHQRVDVVFDQYKAESLKSYTRQQRGEGVRRKVTPTGKLPKDWGSFLRNNSNKTELFTLLADSIYNIQNGIVYATKNSGTVCNKITRESISCSHEEADTRIFVHLKHAIETDMINSACILSNDSDIVILSIAFFEELKTLGLEKLWVSFGTSKNRRWFPIHDLTTRLGPNKSKGLLFFHAFSGCDTVSGFRGKGKKSFFSAWNVFPEITDTFCKLSRFPVDFEDDI